MQNVEAKAGQTLVGKDGQRGFGFAPPKLSGGVKCLDSEKVSKRMVCHLHWLTLVGKKHLLTKVRQVLEKQWGKAEHDCSGVLFYQSGEVYASGVKLVWNPVGGGDHFTVDIPGRALDELGLFGQFDLIEAIYMGMHATRLDVAVDFTGYGDAIGQAEASCRAGELTGARKWKPDHEYECGMNPTQYMVRLGKRPKKSAGKSGRFYDKELESGNGDYEGVQRFEVEFRKEMANSALQGIMEDPTAANVAGYALGAFDFRTVKGKDKHKDRRERVAWFADLTKGVKLCKASVEKKAADLLSYAIHFNKCVLRRLRGFQNETGLTIDEVCDVLETMTKEVTGAIMPRVDRVVRQFTSEIDSICGHVEPAPDEKGERVNRMTGEICPI